MGKYYLGIDTSAYTTSMSLLDEENNILVDLRQGLQVGKNKRGLRQQEAIFQHLNNLPLLIKSLCEEFDLRNVDTIAASVKPRNIAGSYMPVFIFGKNQALILSQALNVNYKEFSHQEGHIAAGLLSNKKLLNKSFISFHISGGTSEIVIVKDHTDNLNIELVGGTLDISFGQLIDRIGVFLGYEFPCGRKLDEVSKSGNLLDLKIPINIQENSWTSISGLENYFKNLILNNKYPLEDILLTLFHTIGMFLKTIILNISKKYNLNHILITGGVSANTYIRKFLSNELLKNNIYGVFPKVELSTDNSVGIAYLGKNKLGHYLEV